ncbi:MAG: AAA family ATPase [Sphingomonadales bacterium]|nr:AAA family ATPase [Sphingomonadales bacterium]
MMDIYKDHFGLAQRPFSLLPDPEFLYLSSVHTQALTMIEYGIMSRAPITLVTGELGAGKTTLLRRLMGELRRDVTMVLISQATGGPEEVLRWIMGALGRPAHPDESHIEVVARFQDYLIEEYSNNRRVLLVVDEAQHLDIETLEVLRLMTNINADKHELIQLLLIGQPELRDRVRRREMMQLAQRVGAGCHVGPMTLQDTMGYIAHRLAVAGARQPIFSEGAMRLVHELAGGIPRMINQICDLSLVYAFSEDRQDVDAALVERVKREDACFYLTISQDWRPAALAA